MTFDMIVQLQSKKVNWSTPKLYMFCVVIELKFLCNFSFKKLIYNKKLKLTTEEYFPLN